MKVYPFDEVCEKANTMVAQGWRFYQQWNCEHCGVKQTMAAPNTMFMRGKCEECGDVIDIAKHGCNYMLESGAGPLSREEWERETRRSMQEGGATPEEVDDAIRKALDTY